MPELEQWGWEWAERDRMLQWLETTPSQRLQWLDEAVEFVARYGGAASRADVSRERS
jgi:hypothetical protein